MRGVLVVGAGGRAFVAGADIRSLARLTPEEGAESARLGHRVAAAIEAFPAPVIACVDGFALGGGLELALACDLIYATDASAFGQPEVKLGLIPGFGGTVRLPRAVGLARAKELIYTGRRIGIDEAEAAGLVARRFPDRDALLAGARATIAEVAENARTAVGLAKRVLVAATGTPTATRATSRSPASRTRSAPTTCARASPRSSRSASRASAAPDAGDARAPAGLVNGPASADARASQANPSKRTPSAPNISRCRCGPVDWPVEPTAPICWPGRDALAHRDLERAVLHVRVGAT